MKTIIKYILIFSIITIFFSCGKSEIVEVSVESDESIVIQGEVKTGEMFSGVKITKTLPIGVVYDIKQAEIKDAYAYVQINGVKIVPLHYTADGMYKTLYNDLKVNEHDIYELFARVNGKSIYSKTMVPAKPVIVSKFYTSAGFIEVDVQSNEGEAYGAVWAISNVAKGSTFYQINEAPQFALEPTSTRTEILPEEYQSSELNGQRRVQVFAFDKHYVKFFETKVQGSSSENSIIVGGSGIAWNVVGENAIGLFIGVAEGKMTDEF